MPDDALSSLIGSRICHDLISPLGAIGNGVELLEMSGAAKGPEMSLISESVQNANARLKLFRLAFGGATGRDMRADDVAEILSAYAAGAKCEFDWAVSHDLPRALARIAVLGLLCLETAAAFGGRIVVCEGEGSLDITAHAPRLAWDNVLWDRLDSGEEDGLAAAHVQFALLARALTATGLRLVIEGPETARSLRVFPS